MPYLNGTMTWNETRWTKKMLKYLEKNYLVKTRKQMAEELGLKIQVVRNKLYELGLIKLKLEYWTKAQTNFLINNYQYIGNVELTEIFNKKWEKNKGWSKKHIEKKLKQLGLKRTEKQLIAIMQRNVDQGRMNLKQRKGKTNWLTTGPAKQGEIRMYRNVNGCIQPRIKIGKCWVFWARWAWIQKYGSVPEGMVVTFKDGNCYNTTINNLELVTKSELTRRNAAQAAKNLTDNYIASHLAKGDPELKEQLKSRPDLLNVKRLQLQLKRKIKQLQDEQI